MHLKNTHTTRQKVFKNWPCVYRYSLSTLQRKFNSFYLGIVYSEINGTATDENHQKL